MQGLGIANQAQLLALLEQAQAEIEQLKKRIEELEARLNKNSKNSSKPPSSDQKGNSRKGVNGGGAKPGHKGHYRAALPPERITRVEEITLTSCSECGGQLKPVGFPARHQMIDLPEIIELERTEYRLHRYRCMQCGKRQKPQLPPEVGNAVMGPRLTSLSALLTGPYGMTVRKTQRFLEELTKESWSVGTLFNGQQRIRRALEDPYRQAEASCHEASWAGADETGWRTCGQRRYVWIKSSDTATYLRITASRSRACAEELLGKGSQPLVTDRYAAYAPEGPHQYCLAHFVRDIEALRNSDAELCDLLLYDFGEVFVADSCHRHGKSSRQAFLAKTGKLKRRLEKELRYWSYLHEDDQVRRFCDRALSRWERFWTFRRVPGMEPTNNRTERDLRPLVIKRKISFGTRSDSGERFIERIYSVVETLKKRGSQSWGYVTDSLIAFRRGLPAPRLPPALAP